MSEWFDRLQAFAQGYGGQTPRALILSPELVEGSKYEASTHSPKPRPQ